jgi:hypothetical protein
MRALSLFEVGTSGDADDELRRPQAHALKKKGPLHREESPSLFQIGYSMSQRYLAEAK